MTKGRRILVLSYYFRPDLSAGSFRTTALVDALVQRLPGDIGIDVITALPHRYQNFQPEAAPEETAGRVKIRRLRVPAYRAGLRGQIRAFAAFARKAVALTSGKQYALVYATSSRLMTATLGAYIAGRTGAALYLDLRDIFVDNMKHLLPRGSVAVVIRALAIVESWTVTRATHVNLVSPGFAGYFKARFPNVSVSHFTNGVDEEFVSALSDEPPAATATGRITVLYAGNIGEGQGLHDVLPALAERLRSRVDFRVVGAGARRAELAQALERSGRENVMLLDPVSRGDLIALYRQADVLFLHLNDYTAFERVLPSKIFEYGAMGKPVWAGVAGYAAEFLRSEMSNVAVFPPCDVEEALRVFEQLELRTTPRASFVEKYSRRSIMLKMADDISAHVERRAGASLAGASEL